ncbi:MAG: bacillithiol system redox-active protein YtxJ [Bacteroidota bacterium]|nr:bacillithiol system redox-active protein YtxJ [Bacteroidota bacterium]
MNWKNLTSIAQLDELVATSETTPVLIFKHSDRCNICHVALNRLERNWKDADNENVIPYFLDLLKHRDVSNAIAERFGITHESPQVLLIRNGKCFYSATHSDINYADIMEEGGA